MNPKLKTILSKIFALAGTILLWAPIAFMFVTAAVGSIAVKQLRFDYLMLAELFFLVAGGLLLLLVASILSRHFIKWFAWGSAAALAAFAGGQLIAIATGLASGSIEPTGLPVTIVIISIVVYNLFVVALAVLGIVLVRRLFRKNHDELIPAA